ncbi:RsmB/NOP family class I SAM-dependent RNA methyltransferase [Pseudoruegeria sp. SK021]|uniref:RsmB/NOP family class I SAM-dependent RNA methyltransferase n=1 Tax=Pseudoruegeria sp. SK021 TaxID=1933035 RepID=UPI000A217CF7|nr:RsmB/NOP family class I SAM-dependent RNA methyltransferase [Pseudoruegeria sp. SK021]OSP54047.1 SAM-dependent methyltransferase [Pseudoruegeria sp. SK021]
MTPEARIAAAIEILDEIFSGVPAERALSSWARGHRFAGSGDRAALRDHVFDALRCRRSFAALGGAETGRGVMIGALRAAGRDPVDLFTGLGHAPPPLGPDDGEGQVPPPDSATALDCPDWLLDDLHQSLGQTCLPVLRAMRQRAPIFLRVNLRLADLTSAQEQLATEQIVTEPSPLSPSALEVVSGARRIRGSKALASGMIELQDAASQAVSDLVPLGDGQRMLDYCAGGGGKTLAVGGRVRGKFFVHDIEPRRMSDLPVRAARAKVTVTPVSGAAVDRAAPYDVVLVDAPCSGSGSWRRDPQGKWALTRDRLNDLTEVQAQILDRVAALTAPSGQIVYMTCSLLDAENQAQVDAFLNRHPGWTCSLRRWFTPLQQGDGFFAARLTAPDRTNTL